uniref:Uncharacterized protein n=1 Tax=Oryza sativa subsp. japonica TaxID=39947 RepID=Q6K4X4_ORYSJ|nr:hypothetical protein [Oryza sativa Japonica Group]
MQPVWFINTDRVLRDQSHASLKQKCRIQKNVVTMFSLLNSIHTRIQNATKIFPNTNSWPGKHSRSIKQKICNPVSWIGITSTETHQLSCGGGSARRGRRSAVAANGGDGARRWPCAALAARGGGGAPRTAVRRGAVAAPLRLRMVYRVWSGMGNGLVCFGADA